MSRFFLLEFYLFFKVTKKIELTPHFPFFGESGILGSTGGRRGVLQKRDAVPASSGVT